MSSVSSSVVKSPPVQWKLYLSAYTQPNNVIFQPRYIRISVKKKNIFLLLNSCIPIDIFSIFYV